MPSLTCPLNDVSPVWISWANVVASGESCWASWLSPARPLSGFAVPAGFVCPGSSEPGVPGVLVSLPGSVVFVPGLVVLLPGFVGSVPGLVVLLPGFVVLVPGLVVLSPGVLGVEFWAAGCG
ncbi:Uncharacterised protein [Mycobacteroides abscessus subsp. abscessus]|nr:Uncharacterised protein [Mycobacteroides abscessus subsp. abscessus]